MRITNQMMINSSIANIQANKNQINTMDTQLSTQKKINKPSDDPIIAIRALRLRSSLDQVTQYVDKNIPDASSWLSVTQDALAQGYDIVYQLYSYCNQGASDSYSSDERNTIIQTLDKLKNSYYVQGDVDYAGRYVFTGFATDRPLTYPSDVKAAEADYTITQSFDRESISEKKVYTNAYTNEDIINLNVKKDTDGKIVTPNVATVHRIQLGYSEVDADGTFRCMQFMAFQNISDKIIFGTVIAETSQMIRLYDLDDSPPIIVIESPLDEFPDVCIGPQYSDLFVCF